MNEPARSPQHIMYPEWLALEILFGGVFALVLAVNQLVLRRKKSSHYFLAALLVVAFWLQAGAYIILSENWLTPRFLNFLFIPGVWFLGPLAWLFFFTALDPHFRLNPTKWLSLAAPTLVLLLLPLVEILWPAPLSQDPLYFFKTGNTRWLDILFVTGLLLNNLFIGAIIRQSSLIWRVPALRHERSARLFLALFILMGAIALLAVAAFVFREILLMYLANFCITWVLLLGHWFKQRNPEFFFEFETVLEKARQEREKYRNSRLNGLNLEDIGRQLESLFRERQIYTNEDLTVGRLAEEMDLKTWQMSEYFSQVLDTNFSQYLNQWRVEAAARLLRENPGANILSVAFQVGFNSKGTFNKAFKNRWSMTPSEYLREKGPDI